MSLSSGTAGALLDASLALNDRFFHSRAATYQCSELLDHDLDHALA